MDKPQLPPALDKELDSLLTSAKSEMRAGDTEAALKKVDYIWETLPEPKSGWDYYSQIVPFRAANHCIEVGQLDRASTWLERAIQGYEPLNERDQLMLDFVRAKLFYRAGQDDLAYTYFDAVFAAGGKRSFSSSPEIYWDFYHDRKTGKAPAKPAAAGSSALVPPIGDGSATGADLPDQLHEEITRIFDEGDQHEDNDDHAAAQKCFTRAITLLPTPRTQWDAALLLYTALADTLLAQEQFDDAETSLQIALQCPEGTGNGYIWLRLGDAQRGQENTAAALESYTSAFMLEGEQVFIDTDNQDQYAWLVKEGIA